MDFLLPGKTKECMYLNFQAFYRQVKYDNFTMNIPISQLFLKRWYGHSEENYRILTWTGLRNIAATHGNELKMWKVVQFSHHAHCSLTSRSGRSWVLQKRYNDFSHLHEELKKSKCLWLNNSLRWPWGWSGLYACLSRCGRGHKDQLKWWVVLSKWSE